MALHAVFLMHLSSPIGSAVNLGGLTGLGKAICKAELAIYSYVHILPVCLHSVSCQLLTTTVHIIDHYKFQILPRLLSYMETYWPLF